MKHLDIEIDESITLSFISNKLKYQYEVMEHNRDVSLMYCGVNEINESGTVNIGQQLYIFSTQKELSKSSKSNIYTVQAGDSFYSIAVKHNMTVKDLMRLNRRINDVVMIGDKLKVYSN